MSDIAREHTSIGARTAAGSCGRWILAAVLSVLLLSACAESPLQPEPEPDLSIGEVFYTCDRWHQGRPVTPRVIVDLVVLPGNLDDLWRPWPVRAADEARVLERAGGRILHRFNAMMLRVDVATDSLAFLVDSMPVAYGAMSVPDTLRTDYAMVLSFDRAPTRQDSIVIRELGGWARVHSLFPQFMEGAIPDSIVPALRARGLVYLQAGHNATNGCPSVAGS